MSEFEDVDKKDFDNEQPMASLVRSLSKPCTTHSFDDLTSDSILDIFGNPIIMVSCDKDEDLVSQRWCCSSETQAANGQVISCEQESEPTVSKRVLLSDQCLEKEELDSKQLTISEISVQHSVTEGHTHKAEDCVSTTTSPRPLDVRPKIFVQNKCKTSGKSRKQDKPTDEKCKDKVSGCENKDTPPDAQGKSKKKKVRTKSNKKWKPIDMVEFGFNFSLVPRLSFEECLAGDDQVSENAPVENISLVCSGSVTPDTELNQGKVSEAENHLSKPACRSGNSTDSSSDDDVTFFLSLGIDVFADHDDFDCDPVLDWDGVAFTTAAKPSFNRKERPVKVKPSPKSAKFQPRKEKDDEKATTNYLSENLYCSTRHIDSPVGKCDKYCLYELECSSKKKVYIRRDKHRRVEKAHKAVKSKNCKSIFNNRGRKTLYMHHRLVKKHNMFADLNFRSSAKRLPFPRTSKSGVDLSAAKEIFKVNRNTAGGIKPAGSAPAQNLRHTLHETNTPNHLDMDLASFLISLQHREMTPEDYEMLLRLDDSVKPKTVSESVLDNLKTDTVGPEGVSSEGDIVLCAICMEPYALGDKRKFLPCGHDFHASCVDTWLKNSSMNCPLDGLPVEEP